MVTNMDKTKGEDPTFVSASAKVRERTADTLQFVFPGTTSFLVLLLLAVEGHGVCVRTRAFNSCYFLLLFVCICSV